MDGIDDTDHNAGTEGGPDVHIGDAGIDVHADRLSIMDKYLLEEHSVYLARFNVCVWHKVAFRTIRTCPA